MSDMLAREVITRLSAASLVLATAESCTGGMIAAAITDIPGSSGVFDRGFVTYSNTAKVRMLGVPPQLIDAHGAVSEQVAAAMATGALAHALAGIAVSVTGIAGPDGGSIEKPVGLVWFGLAVENKVTTECQRFTGDRAAIRLAARDHALGMVLNMSF